MTVESFVIRNGVEGMPDELWWRWTCDVSVFGAVLEVCGTSRTEQGAWESIESVRVDARRAA